MPINETKQQRQDEWHVLSAIEKYLGVRLKRMPKLAELDATSEYGHAFETKGRRYSPERIESMGGIFVEDAKLAALQRYPMGFFAPYFYDPYVVFLIHHSQITKGKKGVIDRTVRGRGQDDRDTGWYVSLRNCLEFPWR